MAKRRAKTRLYNALIAGIASLLMIAFMLSYLDAGKPPGLSGAESTDARPVQFYLSAAHSHEFNEEGKLDFLMTSSGIRHNPKNNSARVNEPKIEIYKDGVLDWTTEAQLGILSDDGQRIQLQQRVSVYNADKTTLLTTPNITIYPEKKLAKTRQPVTLRNPNGFTRAVGVTADLNRKRVDLHSQVRGQYRGINFEDEH